MQGRMSYALNKKITMKNIITYIKTLSPTIYSLPLTSYLLPLVRSRFSRRWYYLSSWSKPFWQRAFLWWYRCSKKISTAQKSCKTSVSLCQNGCRSPLYYGAHYGYYAKQTTAKSLCKTHPTLYRRPLHRRTQKTLPLSRAHPHQAHPPPNRAYCLWFGKRTPQRMECLLVQQNCLALRSLPKKKAMTLWILKKTIG